MVSDLANSNYSEHVEMPLPGHTDTQTDTSRYYRLSLMMVQAVSNYVSLLCGLLAAAYYAVVRHRVLLYDVCIAAAQAFKKGAVEGRVNPLVVELTRPALEAPPQLEKSVQCDVLYDPGPGHHTLDVIFIHGLKGSLERTWKQGMWQLKAPDSGGRTLLRKSSSTSAINDVRANDVRRQSSEMNLAATFSQECETSDKQMAAMENSCKEVVYEALEDEKVEEGKGRCVSRCWPRDWLPQDCPGARVIALNYTTETFLWRPVWMSKRHRTSMSERAWEMMHHLVELGVGKLPIVWVGHSKGGLFVKQMLVHACDSSDRQLAALGRQSRGILFYSVPHRGSPLANLNLPLLRQSIELTEVQKDSAEVIALHQQFRKLLDSNKLNVDVRSFIETTLTLMSLLYVRIVSVESADAEIGELYGVPIDHRNICKPRNRNCFLYKELLSLIESVMKPLPT